MKVLPILDSGPSCVVIAGGLSAEQVQVARQMHALKRELRALRRELTDSDELRRREHDLRECWAALSAARERARREKLRALGHLGTDTE